MALSLHSEQVWIDFGDQELRGELWMPDEAAGVIVFGNEGDGARPRPYGDYLASALRAAHLATFSLELPLPSEPARSPPQDCETALTPSLRAACDWLGQYQPTAGLPLGLCGVGHNACAAFLVAAELGRSLCALVVRGARPDPSVLDSLEKISAPTLLIVGSLDEGGAEKNRIAYVALRCRKRLEIIPGATRSFDEAGIFEVVVRLMRSWFVQQVHFARM